MNRNAMLIAVLAAAGMGCSSGKGSSGSTTGASIVQPVCYPCTQDSDCGPAGEAHCAHETAGTSHGFCAPTCTSSSTCAPGTSCISPEAGVSVCYPTSQTCVGFEVSGATSGSSGATTATHSSSTSGAIGATTSTGGAATGASSGGATTTTASTAAATSTSTAAAASSSSGTTTTSTTTTSSSSSGGSACGTCRSGFSCDAASGLCKAPSGVPQFNHVWVVVMENTDYSSITTSTAPYMAGTFAASSVQMNNYFAVTHPSLPNYIAMTGGDTFGITADGEASDPTYQVAMGTADIAEQLENAGLTWHEYAESMPSACDLSDSGSDPTDYASKHNPMPHFLDTQNGSTCSTDDVSYDPQGSMPGMASDISNGVFFNYVFISPNLCDDGHDSCAPISNKVGQQDSWAMTNLPLILGSHAFSDHGVLFLTWDEGSGSGNVASQIATYIASPMLASPGGSNSTMYTHYSALSTIEAGLGVSSLPQSHGHSDAPITDIWK